MYTLCTSTCVCVCVYSAEWLNTAAICVCERYCKYMSTDPAQTCWFNIAILFYPVGDYSEIFVPWFNLFFFAGWISVALVFMIVSLMQANASYPPFFVQLFSEQLFLANGQPLLVHFNYPTYRVVPLLLWIFEKQKKNKGLILWT